MTDETLAGPIDSSKVSVIANLSTMTLDFTFESSATDLAG